MKGFEGLEIKKGPDIKEGLTENAVLIESPEAKFRIVYGVHTVPQKPEDIGKADAVFLETIGDYSTPVRAENTMNSWARHFVQYRPVIERIEKEKRPVFLADISEAEMRMNIETILQIVEPTLGIFLLASLSKDFTSEKKISRREFLKKSAKAAAGLYFFSHTSMSISAILERKRVDEQSATRAVSRFLMDLNERIHPETEKIILTLRNHLAAKKMRAIAGHLRAESGEVSEKPELAAIFGAAHHGIERALQKEDKELMRIIEKILQQPGLEEARKKIAKIARLDFNEREDRWKTTEIFDDPDLAKIQK
ncbi:MAG: hypothetical protein HYY55_01420 [Candidatus Niyogibacteria bacterium]|nr:MAG: hypothetical protein HYY55_01420 [Candidatus Niyogibacteria bacterium]